MQVTMGVASWEGPRAVRPVLTAFVSALTATVSAAALASPDLLNRLTTDSTLLRAGQWWRALTPVLVQPAGWGQLAFNLLGLLVVGAALEGRISRPGWVLVYLLGGVGSLAVVSAWQPQVGSGGSSDAVAAMIGALVVLQAAATRRARPWWPAQLYAVFFATYLSAFALAGLVPAVVVGNGALLAYAYAYARREVRADALAWGVTAVVLVAGVLMAGAQDGHGIGILLGGALAALILARRALWQRAGRLWILASVLGVWALTLATWIAWVPLLGVDLGVAGADGERAQVGWVSVSLTAAAAAVAAWLVLWLVRRAWPRVAVRVWVGLCAFLTVVSLGAPALLALDAMSRAVLILLHLICGAAILGLLSPPSGRIKDQARTQPVESDVAPAEPPLLRSNR